MIVDPNGPLCPCGQRGCWERYASGSGLGRLGREAAEAGRGDAMVELAGGVAEHVQGEHVTTAARAGDAGALVVMDRFAWWVGLGIANVANLFDPSLVLIGGGLSAVSDLFLDEARRAANTLVVASGHRPPLRVEAAMLGPEAGVVGAALLAAELVI
jgi:glucokinase